jgi:catechol 2,3-dioxygenase-like lactoylglutathione lyase family enzyme
MSDTQMSSATAEAAAPATVPLRLEVTVLGVSDVDRAKAFYQRLGWRLDADFPLDERFRIVQFTPLGSPASIQFGTGVTTMTPGSVKDMYLVADDIRAAVGRPRSRCTPRLTRLRGITPCHTRHGCAARSQRLGPGADRTQPRRIPSDQDEPHFRRAGHHARHRPQAPPRRRRATRAQLVDAAAQRSGAHRGRLRRACARAYAVALKAGAPFCSFGPTSPLEGGS